MRQYIGARYVPKFYENSQNPLSCEWEANVNYEALTVVVYMADTYTSKKRVPLTVGNPRDNAEYWALTGEFNAQVEQYREEVEEVKRNIESMGHAEIINAVLDLGADNTGSTDNQTLIQDLLDDCKENNKKLKLYFPKGTYNFSVGLIVPDNVEIFGDGKATKLYLTVDGNYTGGVICVLGNNVRVHDLRIEYKTGLTGSILPTGAMMGALDILTWIYADGREGTKELSEITHEDRHDVIVERIYSDAFYSLQAEVYLGGGAKLYNIVYRDIYAPNSCVSAQNADTTGSFENLLIDNVVCSFLRISRGTEITNCNINNVKCNLASITGNANINNLLIDGDIHSKAFTSDGLLTYYYNSALYINNSVQIANLEITNAENYTRDIACDSSRPLERIANFKCDRSGGSVFYFGNGLCISNFTKKHQNYTYASGVSASVSGLNYIENSADKVRVKLAVYKSDATLGEVCTISLDSKAPASEFKAPCVVTDADGKCYLGTVTISTGGVVSVASTWIANIRNAIIDTEYSIL